MSALAPDETEKPIILIVDDTPENIEILADILKDDYKIRIATSGPLALKIAQMMPLPDLILLDIMMPDMDGYEVCDKLRAHPNTAHIPVIFVTAKTSMKDEIYGLKKGAVDYISKPITPEVAQQRVATHIALGNQKRELYLQVKKKTEEINRTKLAVIERLGRAAEFKDNETGMHVIRMANYSYLLAKACGMSEEDSETLREAAPMHDVGKIGIPDSVLLKAGKLDDDEWIIMKNHVDIGVEILGDCEGSKLLEMARVVALTHHEKWDGSGYPNALRGDEIHLFGRICAIADVFDALTSERSYKKAWQVEDAFTLIAESAGTHFDPQLAQLFVDLKPQILAIKEKFID
ncbi:MAG: HD domain-containing phosphohydrolase [Psychromonas sp.]